MTTSKKTDDWAEETASIFKLLSDPTRCRILKVLSDAKEHLCVGEIAELVGASHSATSHQLTNLEARGVLESMREGQTVCYEFAQTRIARNIQKILKIFF